MKNTKGKNTLREATRRNFEPLNGGPLSDAECEEIETNMKGFIHCLIDMDDKLKDRMLEKGGVKCIKCGCPILTKQEFRFTSSKPMCQNCFEKEYEEEINEFKKL